MKKRSIAALAGLAVVACVARRYATMGEAMAAVAPELRSPVLPLLPDSYTSLMFPLTRLGLRLSTKPGTGVTVTERNVDSEPAVRVLVTTPSTVGERRPAVLMIHGGGMVLGSPQFEAFEAGRLARELTPSSSHPITDWPPSTHSRPRWTTAWRPCGGCVRAQMNWASTPDRIAVAGSSAGGGLSAAVAQRSTDEGIGLRAQVLVYPMIDDRTALRDDHGGRGQFMWTPAIEPVGVDRVSGSRAADVRGAGVRRTRAAR